VGPMGPTSAMIRTMVQVVITKMTTPFSSVGIAASLL
jgi:hypothetical protein